MESYPIIWAVNPQAFSDLNFASLQLFLNPPLSSPISYQPIFKQEKKLPQTHPTMHPELQRDKL
jgi:hypothetical protein